MIKPKFYRITQLNGLPVETWLDIFCPIPRRQLANQLSFINRFFWSVAYIRLHERGKFHLNHLFLGAKKCRKSGELVATLSDLDQNSLEIAQVPIPENFVGFEEIFIRCPHDQKYIEMSLDSSEFNDKITRFFTNLAKQSNRVPNFGTPLYYAYNSDLDEHIEFLCSLGPLLIGVNLKLLYNAQLLLPKLMPVLLELAQVNSIYLLNSDYLLVLNARWPEFIRDIHELSIGEGNFCDKVAELLANWLCQPHAEGTPRVLHLYYGVNKNGGVKLYQLIQQQFHTATRASNFFARIHGYSRAANFRNLNAKQQNCTTKEHLLTDQVPDLPNHNLLIRRVSMDASKEWLDEWEKKIFENFIQNKDNRRIIVSGRKDNKIYN